MKKLIIFITAALLTVTSFAVNQNAGTSAEQFLKLGAGARASGMGEAFAAVADDAAAIYWNPAGLGALDKGSLSVMHSAWLENTFYEWAGYARPVGNIGVLGIGVQYLSYGTLTKIDETGTEGASFDPTDTSVSLCYANTICGLGVGVNLKYISSKIVNTASAYAADIGLQRRFGKLALGAAVQNIGTKIKFTQEEDPLPLNIKVGGAYTIWEHWIASLDINLPNDDNTQFGAGTEYAWVLDSRMTITGRVGYTTQALDTAGFNGVTSGVGFTYKDYSLDYAYVPYGDLGGTQRTSLTIKF